ncbi:hypothetical protein FRB96_007290 [Tulasnella sp. 330]|nr:hypothetical protein FRB96_007290 [Tulasnella sp. 330]KAG8883872.1 hypothetical protein FRB97_005710 [Tulasnella sp. 331]
MSSADDQLPAPQQEPGSGSTVPVSSVPASDDGQQQGKLPFKKQVEAYAHIVHGTLTRDTEEKQQFQQVLAGEVPPPNDNPVFQDKSLPIPTSRPSNLETLTANDGGDVEQQTQLPFKEQVRSYAHIHSSKLSRNPEEKEHYQRVLAGLEAPGPMKNK